MCGIVALVSRPPDRGVPAREWLFAQLDRAIADRHLGAAAVAATVEPVDAALKGLPGLQALVGRADVVAGLVARLEQLDAFAVEGEADLENSASLTADEIEQASAELIRLKDAL